MTTTYAASAAPLPPPPSTTKDPTNVMGRRFLAWFIDLAIFVAIIGGVAGALWERSEVPDEFDNDAGEYCDALLDANPDFDGRCVGPEESTLVFLIEDGEEAIPSGAALGWGVINFVILQGLTGGSLGKLISGIRVVKTNGERAGIVRSTGRTALWVVDGAPWVFPLVGLITGLTSTGHRRVGDMVMSTYVVGRKHVGTPVNVSPVMPPPGQTAWGAPPTAPPSTGEWSQAEPQPGAAPPEPWDAPESSIPAHPAPAPSDPSFAEPYDRESPPEQTEPSWGQALADESEPADRSSYGDSGADDQESTAMADSPGDGDWPATPADAEPAEMAEPEQPASTQITPAPGSESQGADPTTAYPSGQTESAGNVAPSETPAEPETQTQPAPETALPMPPPEWDAARNTYIQWDPRRQAWLQWDNNSSQWKPIDT